MTARNVSVLALYNHRKQILLQHRTKEAARLPDYWAFFGGGIEGAETPEQALTRELLEELEYKVIAPQLLLKQAVLDDDVESTKYVFVERYNPANMLIQHEGQGMGWWTFDELSNLLIVDHDRVALSKIEEFLK